MIVALTKDSACGEHSSGYCRWYCDWIHCGWISDATRYEWALIGQGIEKPVDTRV